MSAKSARTELGRHDRSVPCGFALNVCRVQLDQCGNWGSASPQPHGFDAGAVAGRCILGTRRRPSGG